MKDISDRGRRECGGEEGPTWETICRGRGVAVEWRGIVTHPTLLLTLIL